MSSLYLHHLILYFLVPLHLPSFYSVFAIDCTIYPGNSLSTDQNSSWFSPSREFAFGFHKLKTMELYLAAIWFNKIPDTIVWSANHDNPAPPGSTLNLTHDGNLAIYGPGDDHQVLWVRTVTVKPFCAFMNDSGNLMLMDQDSKPLWQTFKEPTDTIFPGQVLEIPSTLRSRNSRENYSEGWFQLSLQPDGNLVFYSTYEDRPVAYWATMSTINSNASYKLVFDENGYIYIEEGSKLIYNISKKDAGLSRDFYHMARLEPDGVFKQYRYPRSCNCDEKWILMQRIPEDVCFALTTEIGSGYCGFNSYCSEINEEPQCFCPEGYSSTMYQNGGKQHCSPNFELPSCQPDGWSTKHELVEFHKYENLDWPLSDYDLQIGIGVTLQTCEQLCLYDCFCAVAIHNGQNCWKKKFPLSNGRLSKQVNRTALVKVPKNIAQLNKPCEDKKSSLVLILSILLGSSLFINILIILAIAVAIFLHKNKLLSFSSVASRVTSAANVKSYAYKELEEATCGFKQILGRGAFGAVYKGVLASNPKRFIAVKKLDKVAQDGEKEFTTEVNVIGQTHHKNLVRLLGFCDEGEHRLLVYEYMGNGSLAKWLFGISRPDWNQRAQIAIGIARGLMYLHEECSTQIIHCDIKPQNILLDEFFTPRISDFGLAKLLLAEQTRVARTNIRGTVGYFAPEWFRKASITVKVDVYSFGVVLLELICCKSSVAFGTGDEQEEALMDWVYDCYCKKKLDKLVENDEEARNDSKRLERFVMVAIWCIQEDPSLRPSMKKVTQMLEGVITVSVPPRSSAYSSTPTATNDVEINLIDIVPNW